MNTLPNGFIICRCGHLCSDQEDFQEHTYDCELALADLRTSLINSIIDSFSKFNLSLTEMESLIEIEILRRTLCAN